MIIFGLLFFLAGAVFADNWKIANDLQNCAKFGPKFWCQTKGNAALCHATSYCKEHVWEKQLQVVNDDLCTTCQQYVGTIHTLLTTNATETDMLSVMKEACTILPESMQGMCTEAVDMYGKELLDAVAAYTADPKQFCTLIHLCNSNKALKLPKLKISADYCLTCEQYLGTLHLLISNAETQKEIITTLQSFCSYVPTTYSSECSVLVGMAAPYFIKWFVNYSADPSKFCTTIGLCKSNKQHPLVREYNKDVVEFSRPVYAGTGPVVFPINEEKRLKSIPDDICKVCLASVQLVRDILNDSYVKDAVKESAEDFCSNLPAVFFSECLAYVVQFEPKYYNELVDLLEPYSTCHRFQLCRNNSQAKLQRKVPEPLVPKKKGSLGTAYCETCLQIMKIIDDNLDSKPTKELVENLLHKACTYEGILTNECEAIVDEYAPKIIDSIVTGILEPNEICLLIKLCSSSKKTPSVAASQAKKVHVKSAATCEICQYAVEYLDSELKDNRSEEAIKKALEAVCGYLPTEYKEECDGLVKTYSDQLIQMLIQQLDPAIICKELGLCSTVEGSRKRVPLRGEAECEICQVVMGYIDNLLKGNNTEEEITAALEKVCGIIPSQYKDQCDQLVESYAPIITQLLVEQLDPNVICKELGLCTGMKVKETTECELCQYAMGYLDGILGDKATEDEIKAAVDSLCERLPQYINQQCVNLVNEYGDEIIKALVKELNPGVVCHALKLCTSSYEKHQKYVLALRMSLHGTSCTVCEYVMGYIDSQIDSKTGKEDIEKLVEKACSYLPSVIQNECDALITQYGGQIIDLLVNEIKPDVVCKELKVC